MSAIRNAQRQHESSCDCCAAPDPVELAEVWRPDAATRRALRVMKGRHEFGSTTTEWDVTTGRFRAATVAPDPIYNLFVLRQGRNGSDNNARLYGETLQRVVSPVLLP